MTGNPLDKYLDQRKRARAAETDRGAAPGEAASEDRREVQEGGLIRLTSGVALMLDLRFRTGHRRALPYSYLASAALDPAGRLTLRFAAAEVTLAGRGLGAVHAAIASHTALALVESTSGFDEGGEAPFIESIAITEPGSETGSEP